jgi:hypothetical protein
MEYPAVSAYLGATMAYPNTVFRRLLSNLGRGSVRIGGDSQDTSCWNPTGRRSRRACLFNVGPSLPRVIFSTVAATHWRALVGLNLARNDPSDALTYVKDGILPAATPGSLLGLEIGNEPDLYGHHGLRPSSYSFAQYVREFRGYVNALRGDARTAALPLVGPAFITREWERLLSSFITGIGASRLGFATLHYYPFDRCSTTSAAQVFRNAVGRRFLPATISGTRANVKAYAVGDEATVRVFVLNKDLRAGGPVLIAPSRALGVATITVLRSPALSATTGTTLGSQAIDPLTGLLPHPHTRTIVPDATAGTYTVNVPNASAVMVTMQSANLRPQEWPAVPPHLNLSRQTMRPGDD